MSARDGLLRHLTGQSLCPPPRPINEANGLLDAYRAEVLNGAASLLEALDMDDSAAQLRYQASPYTTETPKGGTA